MYGSTSEESESEDSGMEIDLPSAPWHDDSEPADEADEDEHLSDEQHELNSTDDHLLHWATFHQLNKVKKDDLVRLYRAANLPEDPELLTKAEIITVIMDARQDELASLPPSSPPGRTDAASSDYSSDEGNVAGDEETDAGPHYDAPGRSLSMGNVMAPQSNGHQGLKRKASLRIQTEALSRPRTSKDSSPSTSALASSSTQSPPGHRLRSRKVSASTPVDVPTPTSAASKGRGKGKNKQVEFSTEIVQVKSTSRRSSQKEKDRQREQAEALAEESDLTDLDDALPVPTSRPQPSPRRLRSKDRGRTHIDSKSRESDDADHTPTSKSRSAKAMPQSHSKPQPKRVTPMRKAKGKIKSLKESETEASHEEDGSENSEEDEEGQEVEMEMEEDDGEGEMEEDQDADVQGGDTGEEDEVDELVSSASITPPPSNTYARKTPLRQRLRRRPCATTAELDAEENEGDDEHEEDADGDDDDTETVDGHDGDEGEDDESTIAVEPRRLRNGKIVGDEEAHMDEDDGGSAEGGEEEAEESEETEGEPITVDETEEEAEEDTMEDEVDLSVATAKTLVRLRRDDLVKLCETRNLEPIGTKPQLAEALLQWRDRHANGSSCPSSTGTVRPPSTATTSRRRRKKQSSSSSVPVLLRSQKVHDDEPRTPVPGKEAKDKENDELELDLESLGLEDREIPPEKIQKLEKIGSGGFKDVFIGKFRGRRIAISEFRGQLSAMDIKELKLLGGFDHPNIVRFLGVSIPENTKETPVMIVSELCSNGDLFDYIRNVSAPSLHKVLTMMLDIARGLEYLHMRKPSVIHRDCKSSNILITAKGVAKIADFGLAKVKQSTRSMVRSLVGTVNWQAPELWTAHPKYNHKVDVFSCAMVFWEMLQWHLPNKKFPWEGMNEHAIYEQVGAKKQRPSITGLRKQWCPEIVTLIEEMWAQDPSDRPTMSKVVETLEDLVRQY
ncbi:TKL/TKL-ccin protein kinase [Coprinopsis cinerea okayama7|uniref:TKL/TKL-ccin protein kinase n=1 Tax=Coprinopsis cinerea (strain Okayama-7 / 130 / ATCC MYA-4618 / FGSC 9003) TaxID=240176 RepID=A8NEY7_COPC7|nr:TKL/TKL-ccin protein kinase [Coprinopsis cinerea okayama7\|eukprot:XP_001833165.1 TKL/TKL-ccin protein kinase [Coprinopsis cinerea okayama7\